MWLTDDDERRLRAAMREQPAVFAELPKVKIVTVHSATGSGRKTAVRPYQFARKPEHFTATRCVLCLPGGRCAPQVAAEAAGLHPWTWKPLACYLHPLRLGERGTALVPPPTAADDPDRAPDYPGFSSSTPCGADHADGEAFTDTLADEIAYWKNNNGVG